MSVSVGMCGRRFNEYNGRDRDVKMRATPSFPLLKNPVRRSLARSLSFALATLPRFTRFIVNVADRIYPGRVSRARDVQCDDGRRGNDNRPRVYYRGRATEVDAMIKWNINAFSVAKLRDRLCGI